MIHLPSPKRWWAEIWRQLWEGLVEAQLCPPYFSEATLVGKTDKDGQEQA
jgi:hypothetical protein